MTRHPALLTAVIALLVAMGAAAGDAPKQTPKPEEKKAENQIAPQKLQAAMVLAASSHLLHPNPAVRHAAIDALKDRGDPDVVPALILALRFYDDDEDRLHEALRELTGDGADRSGWHEWMMWQEANPQMKPFAGFAAFKGQALAAIDPNFHDFVHADVAHDIRLEEITWGGVRKDGIPSLDNPKMLTPAEADYLTEDELVFGVSINGDTRAYPLRILDWHEMFNDVIGGVPVALAYCTLCGSGILFETHVEGREKPFVFGSSGLLYRSNKLMFDRETNSLWNQFTGRPVVGTLTGSGIELKIRPVAITSWKKWLARHPESKVLSLDTGYFRPYEPGLPYGDYFASPDLMFPTQTLDKRLKPKDYVFALRDGEHEKAWPVSAFEKKKVINDKVGDISVVLIGDAATRTVRAYASEGRTFDAKDGRLVADGRNWTETETALTDGAGTSLRRLSGHIAYWFAWSGYKPKAAFADMPEKEKAIR